MAALSFGAECGSPYVPGRVRLVVSERRAAPPRRVVLVGARSGEAPTNPGAAALTTARESGKSGVLFRPWPSQASEVTCQWSEASQGGLRKQAVKPVPSLVVCCELMSAAQRS